MNTAISLIDISTALTFIALCVSTGAAVWSILTSGHKQQEREINCLKESMTAINYRVERLEIKIKNLPDTHSIHRIEISIEAIHGDMRALRAELKPLHNKLNQV